MRFETTIAKPVTASGTGLHSGVPVNIRILPAPPSTGIIFVRTDLERFSIAASWKHVARVSYATSLMRQGMLISTTEHLLSVLYSMGIDNAFVEIDNLEVPILDGSGLPFVRLIQEAGIRQYRRKRRYLRIRRPISVEDKGKRISILPAESFRLTCDACGAGGAHHERSDHVRDHHLRPVGGARHSSAGVLAARPNKAARVKNRSNVARLHWPANCYLAISLGEVYLCWLRPKEIT